jgi:hypothetical protein
MWRLFALVFLTAATAHAETYKWVDQNGVVNYSNTPPPAAAKAPQRIAERVSTYEIDPSLRQAIAYTLPTPYELMLQQEWLQRQRLMAERQNVQTIYENPVEPYRAAGYFSYYPVSWVRPAHRRASSSPSPRSSSSSRWR